jgi:hypothetical protein
LEISDSQAMSSSIISRYASKDSFLEDLEIRDVIAAACADKDYHKKRVLMIVPDGTRTCPLCPVFKGVFQEIGAVTAAFDVMIALGTHQPMNEESICDRLEITVEERRTTYRDAQRLANRRYAASPVARNLHSAMVIISGNATPMTAKMIWKAKDIPIWERAAARLSISPHFSTGDSSSRGSRVNSSSKKTTD